MGRYPPSPASSFGGMGPMDRFTDVSMCIAQSQDDVCSGQARQGFGSDYSRYQAALAPDGLPSYPTNLQELTPPIGYTRPDECVGGPFGVQQGQEYYSGYAYTPEMSPMTTAAAEDVITTRSGLNIKRLRPVDSHQIKPIGVEKRRKPSKQGAKPLTMKKHVSLDKPLSEVMRQSGNAQAFDVFSHVHRDDSIRKEEAIKEGKVKRPLNAFLLYRKHVISYVKKELLSEENKNNQQFVSRICGDSWKMETDEVKSRFKKLALAEKTRHSQAFPKYKYTPKQGKKPDADDIRKVERSRAGVSSTRPAASHTSSSALLETDQYSFGGRSQATGMDSVGAQHSLYRGDAYSYSPTVQTLATLYESHYPGRHGAPVKPEPDHGWSQEMLPGGGWTPESRSLPTGAHGRGPANAPTELYIDPALLPGTPEATYHWLPRGDGLQDNHQWGEMMSDSIMDVMPDLDVNGAHNAYLRGAQEDWHVETVDDTGHFNDWMLQEESAGT